MKRSTITVSPTAFNATPKDIPYGTGHITLGKSRGLDMTDTRYVYGANCSWHGPIADIATKTLPVNPYNPMEETVTLPCCPHCGGMLFEFPNKQIWDDAIAVTEGKVPGYADYVAWLSSVGVCWPNNGEALKRYNFTQKKDLKLD